MKWLIEDLKSAWEELQRWQTWVILGFLCGFGLLVYMLIIHALQTDSFLSVLRLTRGNCQVLTNGLIITLFSGMLFFGLAALLALGEFQHYFRWKARGIYSKARNTLIWAISWTGIAVAIAVSALVFFENYCL